MKTTVKAGIGGAALVALGAVVMMTLSNGPSLPDDYLGRWYLTGSGGGIDGSWTESTGEGWVVITDANEFEYYDASGAFLTATPFELSRGRSIFSADDGWILNETRAVPQVIELHPDGSLSISDNVYDGFGASYRRAP